VGASSASPVTNGSTISGTSTVYFVTTGATVTLPLATTPGQQLILMLANVTGASFTIKANNLDTINNEPYEIVTSLGGTTTIDASAIMISDGLHHWYLVYAN
jgi:hypothetical protein